MTNSDLGADKLGEDRDAFYDLLIEAHSGLPARTSEALNARLVLFLANEVGDLARLQAILERAKQGVGQ